MISEETQLTKFRAV